MARRRRLADDELQTHPLNNFAGGYNSFTGSRALLRDNEIPNGKDVVLDDNGSVTKVAGMVRYGSQISTSNAIVGAGVLHNTSINTIIVASGTNWFFHTRTNTSALTGATFTPNQQTYFCQAIDRLYGANNSDPLSFTSDGATISQVTVNGNIGRFPVYYNQRLYMTNASFPDRIYYSNPITTTESSFAVGDFGTFDTNLTVTPRKNAGFIILIPGGGVEITGLIRDTSGGSEYLQVVTRRHGIWRITYHSVNADGSIAHTVSQFVTNSGSSSGRSVIKFKNDLWFFDGNNAVTLGEVANFSTQRITTKSGRVRSEFEAIPHSSAGSVAMGSHKEKLYIAYALSGHNDRIIIYDSTLNAWSSPIADKNISMFLEFTESDGVRRFLGCSSLATDGSIYELETTLNNNGVAIDSFFETKAVDCNRPGLVKRFAFIDVFYSLIIGTLNYQVFVDETNAVTGVAQFGSSVSVSSGIGTLPIASFPVGQEFTPDTSQISRGGSIRINLGYVKGRRISVRFSNSRLSEQFKIDGMLIRFIEGSIYE